MADKKLNEVPVVSDIVTIFGKRSNGEIVQIDKSNLATLLGGLLPLATNETKGLASMNMCIAYVGEGPVICIKPTNLKTYYYTLLTVTVYENGKFKKIDLAVYNPAKGKGHKCSISVSYTHLTLPTNSLV